MKDSSQKVVIWDLEARTSPKREAQTMFIKAPKGKESLDLEIIWEDKEFRKLYPSNVTNPMKSNKRQYIFLKINKVTVTLPEVKIYAYDLDYCTICKFFQENLGEQAQTVINPAPWDIKNENVDYLEIDQFRFGCFLTSI